MSCDQCIYILMWMSIEVAVVVSFHLIFVSFLPQYNKHLFVHIGQTNHSYSDALLESVDIRQIYDKFPEKKGGLKELYGKGPQNSFFLIKFWVSYARFVLRDISVAGRLQCSFDVIAVWWTRWTLGSNSPFRFIFSD